ncbi:glucosamine-6-phosphate deaminase [Lentisphaera profundi]|uniref:Glucosamine-6-phosphate deaminase n=1 Tax=Lentisphaera profundi TaxID=1658616 RepID=A0ABY7VNJ2_9BACT|nr:glucosamine-6-phosphate deaminase [Lentisphaera profundi]WDE95224.1 glucosamine-6-phosphate deaminase [Lentisphaera profundi]
MKLHICDNKSSAEKACAEIFIKHLQSNPKANLGLATGGTPVIVYNFLVKAFHFSQISFRHIKTFNLDEYLGIHALHAQSYRSFMKKHLFDHVDILPLNCFFPCEEINYDEAIKLNGGIDIQLLGLGTNGHIAFNEPGSSFDSSTRKVKLSDQTLRDNKRFFQAGEFQPDTAISMGIKSIINAKEIIMLVTGEHKAKALQQLIEGNITEKFPASILQAHSNITIVADLNAASLLSETAELIGC